MVKSRNYDEIEVSDEASYEFTLCGKKWHCKNIDDIPWALVEDFFVAQEAGNMAGVAVNVDDVFSAVLFPDEVDDFLDMKHDPESGVSYARFSNLLQDIVQEVFGTPTQGRAGSRPGSRPRASSSRAGSPAKASRGRTTT